MNRQWVLVGGIVALLAVAAMAMVKFSPERTGVEIGERAPDYKALDIATGDSVTLREAGKGAVAIVNIWATWCAPCKEEMPAMQRTYAELAPRGFKILAVSIDEAPATDVQAFATELGLTFPLLHDKSGRIQQVYRTTGVPESFLLDRDGRIVKRVIGAHDWSSAANRKLIERYLGGDAASSSSTN
ncbi:MAG: TlpA family protein disulfide reductase [Gemmatimonadales bacterium]|jgi:peroxiredoxin|nr:TlpA family protein disulfide reductase [Gemmatimonadales bacterium]